MSDKNKQSIKEQLDELNVLLEWFEQDDVDVEEALKTFARADALAKKIEERLGSLQNQVNILKERFDQES